MNRKKGKGVIKVTAMEVKGDGDGDESKKVIQN